MLKDVNVINLVLASGKGSRLYPISTEAKPKQFIDLVSDNMMLEDTLIRFDGFSNESYVITLDKYKKHVAGVNANIIYEEKRLESGNSVYNALNDIKSNVDINNTIVIQSPSDHYLKIDNYFLDAIDSMIRVAKKDKIGILGAEPKEVNEQLGYVLTGEGIVEKPNYEMAEELIDKGFYWNTAIYTYKLKNMLDWFNEFYDGKKVQFEKLILPNVIQNIEVVGVDLDWLDVGSHKYLKKLKGVKNYE